MRYLIVCLLFLSCSKERLTCGEITGSYARNGNEYHIVVKFDAEHFADINVSKEDFEKYRTYQYICMDRFNGIKPL